MPLVDGAIFFTPRSTAVAEYPMPSFESRVDERSRARRRVARTATAVASSGLLVGMGAATAAPAMAATEDDCTLVNTLTAPTDDAADIQLLLDADTAIVCLSGTFTLAGPLTFNHTLTLFGLDAAVLDGNDTTRILAGSALATLTVQNLSFVRGSVNGSGGAIYLDGDLTVENSQFTNNIATENGGAIADAGASRFVVTDSVFTGNEAGTFGGAIFTDDITTSGSSYTSNEAELGGAISAYFVAALESTFTENSALVGGAIGSLAADGYASAIGSTFVGNSAGDRGGAVAAYGFFISLNSTYVENIASDAGGALLTNYGTVAFSTFLDNEANTEFLDEQSDAIYVIGDAGAYTIGGNVFAGSRSTPQLGGTSEAAIDDLGGNVFSTSAATEAALAPPHPSDLFSRSVTSIFGAGAALGSNGGPTQTVALVSGSPAIDAVPLATFDISSASVASASSGLEAAQLDAIQQLLPAAFGIDVDQRDIDRNGLADAGAYEFGDAELAATGADTAAMGWLAGITTLLLGAGAALTFGARRRSRVQR